MTLLILFRAELLAAIGKYEQIFNNKGHMSRTRSRNVIDLKAMINDDNYGACELKDSLLQYLNTLHTGWWIFKTGRSRLKLNLRRVINDSRFSDRSFLCEQQQVLLHKQQLEQRLLARSRSNTAFLAASEDDKDTMIRAMAVKLEQYESEQGEAEIVIKSLQQKCDNLQRNNLSLYQKVRALIGKQAKASDCSSDRDSESTCSSGMAQSFSDMMSGDEQMDPDDDSPSNSVYGSLKGFSMTMFPS